MKVSVIIPTLNESTYLPLLLKDLAQQTRKADEIIVVDGGSTDETVALTKQESSVTVIETSKGVGHQRNVGGLAAGGDLLIYCDSDVRIEPNFIEEIEQYFSTHNLPLACPKYDPITNSLFVKAIFAFFNAIFFVSQSHFPAGAGPNICVLRNVFKRHAGFRADLLNDDLEFIHRVGSAEKFAIVPVAVRVSDRRFRTYGSWHVLRQYLEVSWLFVTNRLEQANSLNYPFGQFSTKNQPK